MFDPLVFDVSRAGFVGGSNSLLGWSIVSKITNKNSPELRERTVHMLLDNAVQYESHRSAILSISAKIVCAAQTLNEWGKKAEVDRGSRAVISAKMAEKLKALERENCEPKRANEIPRKASAYFAQA